MSVAAVPWGAGGAAVIRHRPRPRPNPAPISRPPRNRRPGRSALPPIRHPNLPVVDFCAAWPAASPVVCWAACSSAAWASAVRGADGVVPAAGSVSLEIILIGGILYLIYRLIKSRRSASQAGQNVYNMDSYREPAQFQGAASSVSPVEDPAAGIAHIRQFDPAFDEQRFCDQVMDIFFKIQSAWMNRDLTPATVLLTAEVRRIFQGDIDRLIRERRINRLENIAVRNVEIVEAWQESGQDYLTTLIYANLLDYTTDDASGQVVEGSKTEPVKFEEYWTFTRPLGNNQWQLSAIDQK